MNNVTFYIGTGDKCGFYTLHVIHPDADTVNGFKDSYMCNLSTDFDTAYDKALRRIGKNGVLEAEPFQLDEIGRMRGTQRWAMILKHKDPQIIPFGKYAGQNVFDKVNNDPDYIWWMVNSICGQHNRKDEQIPFMVFTAQLLDHLNIKDPAIVRKQEYETRQKAAAELDAKAPPVPITDERLQITGTVLTTKWIEGPYHDTLKMLIRTDVGYKLWGSVPSNLDNKVERGNNITFMAKIVRSDDDEKFGFFKRPTKAQLIKETV